MAHIVNLGDMKAQQKLREFSRCFSVKRRRNVESSVDLPANFSRNYFLDRCRHLVLSEQMPRHGCLRGRRRREP